MVRRDRDKAAAGCFLRILMLLALLVVAAVAAATFYTGAEPTVKVEPGLPGIGRRTPIKIRIEDPQRVTKVRVELVLDPIALISL